MESKKFARRSSESRVWTGVSMMLGEITFTLFGASSTARARPRASIAPFAEASAEKPGRGFALAAPEKRVMEPLSASFGAPYFAA